VPGRLDSVLVIVILHEEARHEAGPYEESMWLDSRFGFCGSAF
jgi:hypothetical protein